MEKKEVFLKACGDGCDGLRHVEMDEHGRMEMHGSVVKMG